MSTIFTAALRISPEPRGANTRIKGKARCYEQATKKHYFYCITFYYHFITSAPQPQGTQKVLVHHQLLLSFLINCVVLSNPKHNSFLGGLQLQQCSRYVQLARSLLLLSPPRGRGTILSAAVSHVPLSSMSRGRSSDDPHLFWFWQYCTV